MNTIRTNWRRIALLTVAWAVFFAVLGSFVAASAWARLANDTIARNIFVEKVDISVSSREEARERILQESENLSERTLTLTSGEKTWSTPSASLGLAWNVEQALDEAEAIGRRGSWQQQYQERIGLAFQPISIPLQARYDAALLESYIATIAAEVDVPGREPSIQVSATGYSIDAGEEGRTVTQGDLVQAIQAQPLATSFSLPLAKSTPPLTIEEKAAAESRLAQLWGKSLQIQISELEPTVTVPAREFFSWLDLPSGFRTEKLSEKLQEWNAETLREPVNAEFERGAEGSRLVQFQPHQNGRALDQEKLEADIFAALLELEISEEKSKTLSMTFFETEPTRTLAETNDLGIVERLGVGTSTYFGSIANRVYNVDLTTQKIGAVLIAPGEEYSFAQSVGDISSASGFRSAYVIRNGRTELGDGGGVCQVSTTIFRAVIDAGLPITRWKNHSYRVSYYEQGTQPGFDATIYAPSVDFRFTNDTGHHLVLVPYNDPESLFLRIEIWGTSDGRESSIENYSFGNVRPAPAPLYQDDPSLPAGTRRQIDWAAPGGTASFDYVVKRNGETIYERNFRSVYRPWQAVFLVGTGT